MNIKIEVYDEDILLATRSTELWEIAEMNLGALRKEFEMERQLKLEDVSDILYEMKRDDQVDEHEDN